MQPQTKASDKTPRTKEHPRVFCTAEARYRIRKKTSESENTRPPRKHWMSHDSRGSKKNPPARKKTPPPTTPSQDKPREKKGEMEEFPNTTRTQPNRGQH